MPEENVESTSSYSFKRSITNKINSTLYSNQNIKIFQICVKKKKRSILYDKHSYYNYFKINISQILHIRIF